MCANITPGKSLIMHYLSLGVFRPQKVLVNIFEMSARTQRVMMIIMNLPHMPASGQAVFEPVKVRS